MTVTIHNHVFPQGCEPDGDITAADLTTAAMQLSACLPAEAQIAVSRQPGKIRQAIDGLLSSGVRPGAIPGWLLVLMALIELLPDLFAVIQRIIDAINAGQRPAEVMAEIRE
jgi:hypothetical protein